MSLFKFRNAKKPYESKKFNGVLFLMTPMTQNVTTIPSEYEPYANYTYSTLNRSRFKFNNNFLVLDKDENCYVQYAAVTSTSFYNNLLRMDFLDTNIRFDGVATINRLMFDIDEELEKISFDTLTTNEIDLSNTNICGKINYNKNERIEIVTNMKNLESHSYQQGSNFRNYKFYNSRENLLNLFKNPLTTFDEFVSYNNDGSFEPYTFSNSAFKTIVNYIDRHISQLFNDLDSIVEVNKEKFNNIINCETRKSSEEFFGDLFNLKLSCKEGIVDKNNTLRNADILAFFTNNSNNCYPEDKSIFIENLKNLLILRCLNSMQSFSIISMMDGNFESSSFDNDCTIIMKNRGNNEVISVENGKINKYTESDIPFILGVTPSNNDDKITIQSESGDEISEEIFNKAIQFIETKSDI